MKKLFRALSLCLTLALCVFSSTSLTPAKSLPDFQVCWIQHLDFHVIPRYHGCI